MRWALAIATALTLNCGMFLSAQDVSQGHGGPMPLSAAVEEAENNNTQIAAAEHASSASEHIARQVLAQAGAQAVQQHNRVSSKNSKENLRNPGQTQSDKQLLPGPTHSDELLLWGVAAQHEADARHAQVEVLRSSIADQVKTTYLRLAYMYQMHDLDYRGTADLTALIQNQLSKYSLGVGSQAEVLQAQLERTKLLRETTLHDEEVGVLEATLKALLHRQPDSPDILPETIVVTPFKKAAGELLLKAAKQNPTIIADSRMIEAQSAQLDAAKGSTNSEFNLGYTFPQLREDQGDEYVLTFNRPLEPSPGEGDRVAAAVERVESSRSQANEDRLRQMADVQRQYVIVTSSDELMRECKDGLIPQSKAVYQSKLAGYETTRESFSAVIEAFMSELNFEDEYLQALLEHETAVAHLETLTGEKLR